MVVWKRPFDLDDLVLCVAALSQKKSVSVAGLLVLPANNQFWEAITLLVACFDVGAFAGAPAANNLIANIPELFCLR